MNKLHYLIIGFLIIVLLIFSYVIYIENQDFKEEQLLNKKEISEVKNQQQIIDNQFQSGQIQKEKDITNEQLETLNKDQDGDGLTYQQEVALGTSDNNIDSDSDGIPDNNDAAGTSRQCRWRHHRRTKLATLDSNRDNARGRLRADRYGRHNVDVSAQG